MGGMIAVTSVRGARDWFGHAKKRTTLKEKAAAFLRAIAAGQTLCFDAAPKSTARSWLHYVCLGKRLAIAVVYTHFIFVVPSLGLAMGGTPHAAGMTTQDPCRYLGLALRPGRLGRASHPTVG